MIYYLLILFSLVVNSTSLSADSNFQSKDSLPDVEASAVMASENEEVKELEINTQGGDLSHLARFQNIEKLTIQFNHRYDARYPDLPVLPKLKKLVLLECNIDDMPVFWERIAKQPNIESVKILGGKVAYSEIQDQELQLKELVITHTHSNGSWEVIIPLLKDIESLNLSNNSYEGTFSLESFERFVKLRSLNLSNNPSMIIESYAPLAVLPELKSLDLSRITLSEENLRELAQLNFLQELTINVSPVNQLEHLAESRALEKLRFSNWNGSITLDELLQMNMPKQLKSLWIGKEIIDLSIRHEEYYFRPYLFCVYPRSDVDFAIAWTDGVIGENELSIHVTNRLLKKPYTVEGISFESLTHMNKTRNLTLHDADLTHTNLSVLGQLEGIESLDLSGCQLSPENIEQISWLCVPDLQKVKFSNTIIRGIDFYSLSPNLQEADLSNTNVGTGDVKKIIQCHRLETLLLANTKVSYTAIKEIGKTKAPLETLDLSGNKLRGADFSCLASITTLKKLSLNDTELNVVDMKTLEALPQLEILEVRNIKNGNVNQSLIEELQATLPNCTISF